MAEVGKLWKIGVDGLEKLREEIQLKCKKPTLHRILEHSFSTRDSSFPRGMNCLKSFFGGVVLWETATCLLVEAKGAAKHPKMNRSVLSPHPKQRFTLSKVYSAKIETLP